MTPDEWRALVARKHAEGAARVRAIVASEAPQRARARSRPPHVQAALDAYEARKRAALAFGALAVVRLDVRTPNPLNASTGSSRLALARTKRAQRTLARELLGAALGRSAPVPCRVLLGRVAPSAGLDAHDALPAALKAIVDGIADALGLASDRDPRVAWVYGQRRGARGEHAVEIEVWPDLGRAG